MKIKNCYKNVTLINPSISLGFFTRENGFSENNYSSLNCSYSSGDERKNVIKNINKSLKFINKNKKNQLKLVKQTHSNKVILVNKKNFSSKFEGDAIITQDQNISIGVLTADCCPIFLFDNDSSFIACVHSGWKGSQLNIIDRVIKKIKKIQKSDDKINAIIGPCLSQKNFEVTEEFRNNFLLINNKYKYYFLQNNNKYNFDMRGLINFQLKNNNINNIENINIDTYSNKKLFFSHRRSTHNNSLPTGRMINIISFNK